MSGLLIQNLDKNLNSDCQNIFYVVDTLETITVDKIDLQRVYVPPLLTLTPPYFSNKQLFKAEIGLTDNFFQI